MGRPVDEILNLLVAAGRRRGYLTYTQVNVSLPDEATKPEHLDRLLRMLENERIEVIADEDAEVLEAREK